MISQYRTGLPMVDLFFSSFATMIDMQRAFVLGGTMTVPVSKALVQPPGEIARETNMKQEVETARDTGLDDQKKSPMRRPARAAVGERSRGRAVRRPARTAAGEKSPGRAVAQNPRKRKNQKKAPRVRARARS